MILKSHYGKNARNQILKMFLTLSAIFFPTSTTSDVGVVIWLARNNYLHNLCVAFSLYGLFILHVTCFINFFIECISYGSPQFSATLISFILCTSLAFSISFACFYFFVFRMAIGLRQSILMEHILYKLQIIMTLTLCRIQSCRSNNLKQSIYFCVAIAKSSIYIIRCLMQPSTRTFLITSQC